MSLLLAADIGGTKSDLALFDLAGEAMEPQFAQQYKNSEFANFDQILADFLDTSRQPDYGCLGVAAVVRNGEARLTNLDWVLKARHLQDAFNIRQIHLINDLTAVCSSLPLLHEEDLFQIQQGSPEKDGVLAVIAPGTGLGEGYCVNRESFFFPRGTEGGHCDFAPLNREQVEILYYLQHRYPAVSYELLCSGKGIPNIFDFYTSTGHTRDVERFKRIQQADDRTPLIVEGATTSPTCPLCEKTLSVFLGILGAEAGNLALKNYATGGLFIGGGILPRIIDAVSFAPFLHAFQNKDKMEKLMQSIPIHLITKKQSALLGAANYGRHHFLPDSSRQ